MSVGYAFEMFGWEGKDDKLVATEGCRVKGHCAFVIVIVVLFQDVKNSGTFIG